MSKRLSGPSWPAARLNHAKHVWYSLEGAAVLSCSRSSEVRAAICPMPQLEHEEPEIMGSAKNVSYLARGINLVFFFQLSYCY